MSNSKPSESELEVIQAFLNSPSSSLWDQAKDVVVAHVPDAVTLEQAVESVSFFGWGSAPDAFSVYRALNAWGILSDILGAV